MFADYTVKGVCAMLAADPTATEEECSRVAAAMSGRAVTVVKIAEVCRRLGRSRPTVWRLVKGGRLRGVPGTGGSGNIIGVTSDSLEGYLAGRAEP